MDFKKLTYFLAVAEELNIGRAATRLDMAQPPLSRQIAALEDELGVQLLDRSRSQIRLTQAGTVLRDHARQLLERLDIALRETRRVGTGSAGRLSVAFVGSASYGVLPAVFRSYRESYPDVKLDPVVMNSANLQRALVEREIDIAVARPGLEDQEFRTELLHTEPLVLALPEGSGLRDRVGIRLADLAAETLVLPSHQSRPSYATVVLDILAHEGIEPSGTEVAPDFSALICLVSVGAGVALVPQSVSMAQRPGVIFRPYEGYNPGIPLTVHARLDNRAPQVLQFLETTRKLARTLRSGSVPVMLAPEAQGDPPHGL